LDTFGHPIFLAVIRFVFIVYYNNRIKNNTRKIAGTSTGGIDMLNIRNIENLIVEEEESFLNDVCEDITEMSSAEAGLGELADISELNELNRFLAERGITFWLLDEPKINPDRRYNVWISRTKGNHPHWGLTPVDKDGEIHPCRERKHRS
jgi:hypothetical protein